MLKDYFLSPNMDYLVWSEDTVMSLVRRHAPHAAGVRILDSLPSPTSRLDASWLPPLTAPRPELVYAVSGFGASYDFLGHGAPLI